MSNPVLPARRLVRAADGRVAGGVARGLASFTGLPVRAIRIAFVVLCAAQGLGVAADAIFWVFLPQDGGEGRHADRRAQGALVATLLAVVVAFAVFSALGWLDVGISVAPLLAAVAGVALVWQQADVAQR